MLAKVLQHIRFGHNRSAGIAVLHIREHEIQLLLQSAKEQEAFVSVYPVKEGDWQSAMQEALGNVSKMMALTLIISPAMYQIVQLEKPALDEQELMAALPWQIKDLTDITGADCNCC